MAQSGLGSACRLGWLLALVIAACPAARADPAECTLEPGPTRAVSRVIDGETLALDDGSEVRLVGALAPRPPDSGADIAQWPPEREAKAALERLVQGRSVDLAFAAGRRTDRYGRVLAHVFVHEGGSRRWVQAALLAGGHARAYALPGTAGCLPELLAHERLGREQAAGLWANAAYQIRPASRSRELARYRSTFQIVEGRVARVSEARGQLFLGFGEDWRADFTAVVKASERRRVSGEGGNAKVLEGRLVRVRGWIERRYGPVIEVHDPAQIEVLDGEGLAATKPP
jgi:endonuclease YncB( thermonuclease family)